MNILEKFKKHFVYKEQGNKKISFPGCVKVIDPAVTLIKCQELMRNKIPGAYLRFGDGDVNLLEGHSELLQNANELLKNEMKEAFNLFGPGIIKSLPIHSIKFGLMPGMSPGMHQGDDQWAIELLNRCYPYFIGNLIYSAVALHYVAVFNQELAINFLKFLKSKTTIFVGNKNVSAEIINKLFGNAIHIKTPEKQSYLEIDRIEQEIKYELNIRKNEYVIIVMAMGCSGRVLAKRLHLTSNNIFIFDFGSLLDAFCGWSTRAWIQIAQEQSTDFRNLLNSI